MSPSLIELSNFSYEYLEKAGSILFRYGRFCKSMLESFSGMLDRSEAKLRAIEPSLMEHLKGRFSRI
jgi:hypothetical protein